MSSTMTASGIFTILLLTALTASSIAQEDAKLDCYPIEGATKEKCEALGCVWSPVERKSGEELATTQRLNGHPGKSRVDEPWCYFPSNYTGYIVAGIETYDSLKQNNQGQLHRITLRRVRPSALGNMDDINKVFVDIYELNDGNMLRLRVIDAESKRFEPELPVVRFSQQHNLNGATFKRSFTVELSNNGSASGSLDNVLIIKRASNGNILFETDLHRLIYTNKFIQLNSKLNTEMLYGLGEHFDNFLKFASDYRTYSFWNTDKLTLPDGQRSYGGFPFYVGLDQGLDEKIQAHGVYLRNSNAMDIVLQKDQSITYRPIGGILDFFFFIGPNPMEVVRQYQMLVGYPDLPPRWALGYHLCRYNYGSLNKTKQIWKQNRDAGIPFDVQWNDIDYMDRFNDFTYDKNMYQGLPEFVDDLHTKFNMHYMILFDPGVSQEANYYPYNLGEQMDIWIKNATNQTLVGKVWNKSGRTVFPDFTNPASVDYWSELFVKFQQEVKFDGAWIDMNDISNFVDGSLDGCPSGNGRDKGDAASAEVTPYKPGGYDLQHKTLCLSAKHYQDQLEYNVHNLYSFYEAIATQRALEAARPGKRSLIISRSTHPGQGHYGGHWSGDVLSNWDYLKWSIPSLLEHSMYGFNIVGSDICGFVGNTTEELCARWSTLGAFYTFSRNHNDDVSRDQDPVSMGPVVVRAAKNALTKKYSYLPYFYTLLHEATNHGRPVARSLSFEFFEQRSTFLVETQFMIGGALMVSPILRPNSYSLSSYLPKGRWYATDVLPESEKLAPKLIDSDMDDAWYHTDQVGLDNIVLFIRGGHILPYYSRVGQTTKDTVDGQPISLQVALCKMNRAQGRVIYDDGESRDGKTNQIEMMVHEGNELNITMVTDTYQKEAKMGQVRVFGVTKQIKDVSLNYERKLIFDQVDHMIWFDLQGTTLSKERGLLIVWS